MQRNVKLAEGADIDALCDAYTDFINCSDLLKVRYATMSHNDMPVQATKTK